LAQRSPSVQAFSLFNRRHHCRRCGGIFCAKCTDRRITLAGFAKEPVRVCRVCYDKRVQANLRASALASRARVLDCVCGCAASNLRMAPAANQRSVQARHGPFTVTGLRRLRASVAHPASAAAIAAPQRFRALAHVGGAVQEDTEHSAPMKTPHDFTVDEKHFLPPHVLSATTAVRVLGTTPSDARGTTVCRERGRHGFMRAGPSIAGAGRKARHG
jgi:hypothetical protein